MCQIVGEAVTRARWLCKLQSAGEFPVLPHTARRRYPTRRPIDQKYDDHEAA